MCNNNIAQIKTKATVFSYQILQKNGKNEENDVFSTNFSSS